MLQDQLKLILDKHKEWLKGNCKGTRADLSGANLYEANLSGAKLYEANLYGANLSGANLSRTDLSGANLSGANLYEANLSGANLSGANLYGANLSRANLSGANLSGANLYGANLSGARSDFSLFLGISGMEWFILIKNDLVKIGCQEHTYLQWKNFSDSEVSKMDSKALDFYYMIIPILDYHFKGTKFEIKE